MEHPHAWELRQEYKKLFQKQQDGSFDKDDALNWLSICSELGKLGYEPTQDQTDWIPKPESQ